MASRIVHLAISKKIVKQCEISDANRFLFGSIMPDAVVAGNSHRKINISDGRQKTYDLTGYRRKFSELMKKDDLYMGFYLHLVQDMIFRQLVYKKYGWNPRIEGNVTRLHNDYALANAYVIQKYRLCDDVILPSGLEKEPLLENMEYDLHGFFDGLHHDFVNMPCGEIFFFTKDMLDEYISLAVNSCLAEIEAIKNGNSCIDEYKLAWDR